MRFIMTLFWALLIGGALSYVLASMNGDPFNLTQSLALSIGTAIGIVLLDAVLTVSQPD